MKKFVVILVLILAGWFVYTKFAPKETKENNAVISYADNLKTSEEKASAAKNTADVAVLQNAVNSFKGAEGRYPATLQELVEKNYIGRVPSGDYKYDALSGSVSE